jgi:hypothetical protein
MSVIDFTNLRDIHFGGNTLMLVRLGNEQLWPKPPVGFTVTDWGQPGMFSGDNAVLSYMVARDGRPHSIPGLTFSELDTYSDAQPKFTITSWGTLKAGDIVSITYRNMSVMYDRDRTVVIEIDGAGTPHRQTHAIVPKSLVLAYSVNPDGLSPPSTVSANMLARAGGQDWDGGIGPNQKTTPDGTVAVSVTPTSKVDVSSSESLAVYKIGFTGSVASSVEAIPAGAIASGNGKTSGLFNESLMPVDVYEFMYAASGMTSVTFTFNKKVVKVGDVYGIGVAHWQAVTLADTFAFIHIM